MDVDPERIERRLILDVPSLKYVWRKGWGAKKPEDTIPLQLPVKHVLLTYTETPPCTNDHDCRKVVKELQSKHIEEGCTDIQWNFIVGGSGKVYEGRGWDVVPQKLPEFDALDRKSLDIAYIGRTSEDVTPNMVSAKGLLIKLGLLEWFIDTPYNVIEAKTEDTELQLKEALIEEQKDPYWFKKKPVKLEEEENYDDIIDITDESIRMEQAPRNKKSKSNDEEYAEPQVYYSEDEDYTGIPKSKRERKKLMKSKKFRRDEEDEYDDYNAVYEQKKGKKNSKKGKKSVVEDENVISEDENLQPHDEDDLSYYNEILKPKKKSKKVKGLKGKKANKYEDYVDDENEMEVEYDNKHLKSRNPKRKLHKTKKIKGRAEDDFDDELYDYEEEDIKQEEDELQGHDDLEEGMGMPSKKKLSKKQQRVFDKLTKYFDD